MLKSRLSTFLLLILIAALVVLVVIQSAELAHRTEAARLREEELTAAQNASQSGLALQQSQKYQELLRKEIQRLQAQTKALESEVRDLRGREAETSKAQK